MIPIKWISLWFAMFFLSVPLAALTNYVVDPYGIYGTGYFDLPRVRKVNKIRLFKVLKTKEIKPSSIVLGTSRAEHGISPDHDYFIKPSYNLAVPGSTIYEAKLNLLLALKQGGLKKVLLVADFIMFNTKTMMRTHDFESYFNESDSIYKYLFSIDVLRDSLDTIKGSDKYYAIFLENGQRETTHFQKTIDEGGGHFSVMDYKKSNYYKQHPAGYLYGDTKRNSFDDFEEILRLCYENNIDLDIVFGPNHIWQWEALDAQLGYEKWLTWKKDVVLSVDKVANEYHRDQHRVFDFSVYHDLTSETVPLNKDEAMRYHWESSHYKSKLGDIVLGRLNGVNVYNDFGYELNKTNIISHMQRQRDNRKLFMKAD